MDWLDILVCIVTDSSACTVPICRCTVQSHWSGVIYVLYRTNLRVYRIAEVPGAQRRDPYRPACVLARVPGLAVGQDQAEEVPLAADLDPVGQLVVQGFAVPVLKKASMHYGVSG
jgi:hypothetical protein